MGDASLVAAEDEATPLGEGTQSDSLEMATESIYLITGLSRQSERDRRKAEQGDVR
jgi:hypothetical protein